MKVYRAQGFSGTQKVRSKALIISIISVIAVLLGGSFVLPEADDVEAAGSGLSAQRTLPQTSGSQPTLQDIETTYTYSSELSLQQALSGINTTDKTISISVHDLTSNVKINYKGDNKFDSASLYKTLAAYRILQLVDEGRYSLNQTVQHEELAPDTTLQDCIREAIVVSDNPCGIVLQKLSVPAELDQLAFEWGLENTTVSGFYPQTSTNDQVQLFQDIYEGKRLSSASQELLLTHLRNQRISDRVPNLSGSTFMHKTGDLDGVVHSTALVESDNGNTYVVSILTDNWNESLLSKYSEITDIHAAINKALTQQ